jgi:hypothetical protein
VAGITTSKKGQANHGPNPSAITYL